MVFVAGVAHAGGVAVGYAHVAGDFVPVDLWILGLVMVRGYGVSGCEDYNAGPDGKGLMGGTEGVHISWTGTW